MTDDLASSSANNQQQLMKNKIMNPNSSDGTPTAPLYKIKLYIKNYLPI